MWFLIIYFIGFIFSFSLCIYNRKNDAKEYYNQNKVILTNGYWLSQSIGLSIFSWFTILIYFLFEILPNILIFKKIHNWLNSPIKF